MLLTINNTQLEGKWFGPPPSAAPTIVLLHEGLGSVSTWRNFPAQLSQATGAGVFAYSRAGHGQSSPATLPRPLDAFRREAQDILPQVLDAIGFREGLLLGHSDGGSIVAIFAGHVRDPRVNGIVVIEPHFNVEGKNLSAIRQLPEKFATTDLRARLARHHLDADTMFAAWSGMWLDPGFASLDLTQELASIGVPVLFLKNEDDPYSTMEQVRIAEAACRVHVETVIIPGNDHSPHKSNPTATLAAIARFCGSVLGKDAGKNA